MVSVRLAKGLAENSDRCRNIEMHPPVRGCCHVHLLTLSTPQESGGAMVWLNDDLVPALAEFSERYDYLMHGISREVSRHGYTPAEGRIIEILGGRILSQADLRRRTHIERGQLSRAINNLVAKGLVERSLRPPHNWPFYTLTELGLKQHLRVTSVRHDAIYAVLSKMLRPDRKALINALARLGKQTFVDGDAEQVERYRTAYPGEVSEIIKNALDFYSHPGFKFNSQIEGHVLGQFAEACERTHHHIIVFERSGYIAGSVLVLVDQKNASARFEGLWFAPWWFCDEDVIGVLKLAEKRVATAGCRNITARIPRHDAFPNMFKELSWTFVNVATEKIAGEQLEIETWSLAL